MKPGPWMIPNEARICRRCDTKVILSSSRENLLCTRCPHCNEVDEHYLRERKEDKPCDRCKFVRRVIVKYPDPRFGSMEARLVDKPRWRAQCLACEAEVRALWYAHEARRFGKRARQLRAKQMKGTTQT
jgi:phage FluMu protein Com